MRLMREVRFSLVPAELVGAEVTNAWAGWPGAAVVAPYLVLRAVVSGAVDPHTGYLCGISVIDGLLRERAIPLLRRRYEESAGRPLPVPPLLPAVWRACVPHLPPGVGLDELHLRITPYLSFALRAGDLSMIRMTESFEFAASHRLHRPRMSDEENRRVFGKCNNPTGHGHNYTFEVTVEGTPDERTGVLIELPVFEAAVKSRVIDALDHKHLNTDCEAFASLNPTVENIARVIWDRLVDVFGGCRLCGVRVWETPKTYAEYDGREG